MSDDFVCECESESDDVNGKAISDVFVSDNPVGNELHTHKEKKFFKSKIEVTLNERRNKIVISFNPLVTVTLNRKQAKKLVNKIMSQIY